MSRAKNSNNSNANVEPFACPLTGFRGWRARISSYRGIPTPAVADGRVFFGGGFGSYEFYCLDQSSGALLWQLRTRDDGPTAATVCQDHVAFNTESCTVYVVDAKTGRVLWERWLGDPLLAQPAMTPYALYAVYPSRGDHALGAFALKDGVQLWETRLTHDAISAVVFAEGYVHVSTYDGKVWKIDPTSGKVLWVQDRNATSAPWVADGQVYVAEKVEDDSHHRSKTGWAPESGATSWSAGPFEPDAKASPGEHHPYGGAATGASARDATPRERTTSLRGEKGDPRWVSESKQADYLAAKRKLKGLRNYEEQDSGVGFSVPPASAKLHHVEKLVGEHLVSRVHRYQGSRPVVWNGVLFQANGDELEATEVASGRTLWKHSVPRQSRLERAITPPAVANGRVWAGTIDGRIICWDARSGQVHWEVAVGSRVHWQPSISEGRVYVGLEDGSLVSFATGSSADDGWPMWGGGPGHNG
ncbi:MAG: PQQ-binding-like beta-propeller repeat protein [Candidatus Binatia bacterium]|nr:PQQ-binding-like beta-propeller repeat protein [Candidatus Binatia bacterium]